MSSERLQLGRLAAGASPARWRSRLRRLLARRARRPRRRGRRPEGGERRRRTARPCRSRPRPPAADRRLPVAATRTGGRRATRSLLLTGDAAADYRDRRHVRRRVAPAASRLLSKMSGNGHRGGAVYAAGSPEYQTLLQWIRARSTTMNRRRTSSHPRVSRCAAAVALAPGRLARSSATPAPTGDVPGPRSSPPGPHARHRRADAHASRPRPRTASDASYTFSSADPAIATVDGHGLVTGVARRRDRMTVTGATTRWRPPPRRSSSSPPSDAIADPLLRRLDDVGARRRHREAFNNWNSEGSVPTTCARCHSSEGFVDYIGRRRHRGGRGRQARADAVGDPLRHLPQRRPPTRCRR